MYLRVAVGVIALIAVLLGLNWVHSAGVRSGRAECAEEREKYVAAATKALARKEAVEFEAAQRLRKLSDAYSAEIARGGATAAAARADLERLRRALARPPGGAEPPPPAAGAGVDDPTATLRELFGACAAEYQGLAEEAGELAARVSGLQAREREWQEATRGR
jgi:hypothetical protein